MLFAVVLGIMLGVVATTLVRQWLQGALTESAPTPRLSAADFPRLAPPTRRRPVSPRVLTRPYSTARRAA